MPNDYSLLKDLESRSDSYKIIYQIYEIELGFESINVHIPEENSMIFEEHISGYTGVSSYEVQKIAKKYNGYIKE